jgi:hypothetical protein
MEKIVLFIITFITSSLAAQNQKVILEPKVDKRVEITSIAFRLAGSEEYNSEIFKVYTDRINQHYAGHKEHELIDFIKKIRNDKGVSYDAVMKMAVHLDENLDPLVPFNDKVPESRWGHENAYKFAELLKDFYHSSNSAQFFESNEDLYSLSKERFLPIYNKLDLNWYTEFYGNQPNEKFIIVNGLGNGGGNYGPSVKLPNGQKEVYAIMGAWNTDSEGMVEYPINNYFPTLLHEFNHSFINELLEKNYPAFENSAKILFEQVREKMNNGAYESWQTMVNEALVRAAVIKYMQDHSFTEKQIELEKSEQINRGFIWIEDLVRELDNYDKQRDKYPTLENYIPQLVRAYKMYAENLPEYIANSKMEQPQFVSIEEFKNGSTMVDPNLQHISLNFDKPFTGSNFIKPGETGKTFPNFTQLKYSEDRKTVILEWELEGQKDYEFILIGFSPKTENSTGNEDLSIYFSTK